jgi:hypothetical protein
MQPHNIKTFCGTAVAGFNGCFDGFSEENRGIQKVIHLDKATQLLNKSI